MPRQRRIVFPGELHHVTQRGNFRQQVFFDDQDRAVYLKYINEQAKEQSVQIYAYCLMNNHVHFIVKPREADSLGKMFRVAHQKYSLYLNKRQDQYGHRWQSRFYSCVVLGRHVWQAIRYVEMNPVRARIVAWPWEYGWSSTRAHMGKTYHIIELEDIKEYVQTPSWKEYLTAEQNEEDVRRLRESTRQGRVFGPVDEIVKLQKQMKTKLLPRAPGRPKKKVTDTIFCTKCEEKVSVTFISCARESSKKMSLFIF